MAEYMKSDANRNTKLVYGPISWRGQRKELQIENCFCIQAAQKEINTILNIRRGSKANVLHWTPATKIRGKNSHVT
jgi:hypothetical protein